MGDGERAGGTEWRREEGMTDRPRGLNKLSLAVLSGLKWKERKRERGREKEKRLGTVCILKERKEDSSYYIHQPYSDSNKASLLAV